MTMTQRKKNLRIYEAIAYEDALDASEKRAGLSYVEREDARQIIAHMRARVIEKQRADRGAARAVRVRPSIVAMVRDAMLQRFEELFAGRSDAMLAFRDLTELSDDDLRAALEDAEQLAERMS
jgi:hypothetical protein